jgi:hypothetical protein
MLNDLREAISQAMNYISPTILRRVSHSLRNRVELYLQENGGHSKTYYELRQYAMWMWMSYSYT